MDCLPKVQYLLNFHVQNTCPPLFIEGTIVSHLHHPSPEKQMSSNVVVVLDNGAGQIKAGFAGERDPTTIVPNCTARPLSSKKFLIADQLLSPSEDLTSAVLRRPFDRGYLINPDLQSSIWSHIFSSLLHITPSSSSLLLTEPLFNLASIQRATDEIIFEEFNFRSLFVSDSPSLVHLYEASRRPYDVVSKAQCSLIVDVGFSFTHAAPVFQNFTVNYGVKRMDLGGKALTNYLKELVSYRSVNVMDETFLIDDVKEKLCFVSSDVARDLQIARRRGNDNHFRCTYVLPDGITHTRGYVKDPIEAQKYLTLSEDGELPQSEETDEADQTEAKNKPSERSKVDLTKNEFSLSNERFLVPEMIFRPADLGMNQAGLAECIVRAVNSCHPHLHPVLYESIILTGGSTLFPGFAKRLENDLRPLVPDVYQVKITTQEDPILGVWRGGSLLASSPDFDAMCVTKAEYEEHGSSRCRRRFFH
uniref:Actin-related protein 6 n=2 Tax=Helianthus annuus TaxID=4232 RepID=A0A251TSI6_HELAN